MVKFLSELKKKKPRLFCLGMETKRRLLLVNMIKINVKHG